MKKYKAKNGKIEVSESSAHEVDKGGAEGLMATIDSRIITLEASAAACKVEKAELQKELDKL